LNVEPAANTPVAEILTGTPSQPETGAKIVAVDGATIEIEEVAAVEEHPPVVTIKLAVPEETPVQETETGLALDELEIDAPELKLHK
jgi:hypothetical protein